MVPIVLSQNEVTESGHEYADVYGREYEYPKRYSRLVIPGTRFVYYRGRRSTGGQSRPPVYLGVGRIGQVRDGPRDLLVCDIVDYREFPAPVVFKQNGVYLEPGANDFPSRSVGMHFRPGVRSIDDAVYARICMLGLTGPDASP